MKSIDIRCAPEPFASVLAGDRIHELRKDDRGLEVGDEVTLHEWTGTDYTGRVESRLVSYVARGAGIPAGYCCIVLGKPNSEEFLKLNMELTELRGYKRALLRLAEHLAPTVNPQDHMDPEQLADILIDVDDALGFPDVEFQCPECFGHHFGSGGTNHETIRCHDEFAKGCQWSGPRSSKCWITRAESKPHGPKAPIPVVGSGIIGAKRLETAPAEKEPSHPGVPPLQAKLGQDGTWGCTIKVSEMDSPRTCSVCAWCKKANEYEAKTGGSAC